MLRYVLVHTCISFIFESANIAEATIIPRILSSYGELHFFASYRTVLKTEIGPRLINS